MVAVDKNCRFYLVISYSLIKELGRRAIAYSNFAQPLRVETTQLARKVRSNALLCNTQRTKTGGHVVMPICFSLFSLLAAVSLTGSAE